MITLNKIDLDQISLAYNSSLEKISGRIILCAGTACVANGAYKIRDRFLEVARAKELSISMEIQKENSGDYYLSKSGCQGFCQMGPLVTILPANILYTRVKPEDVEEIIDKTIIKGELVERLVYKAPGKETLCPTPKEIDFYKKQRRFVLKDCGIVDPEDIQEYISRGGYKNAEKVLKKMEPEEVCQEILEAGLRGRGGGGFPTGRKWALTLKEKSNKKYVICNGDEGDPGAFMDRSVMEGNPHSVIEGMIIAAKAIGADEGYVYVRAEYPLAVARMKKAVNDAESLGLLGNGIFNSDFNFKLHVMEGAGAFVCGEETALISSIEGKRGMPSPKPPYPAQKGLWGKPTVINNVETLATIPLIMNMGHAEFRKIGTENSPGTKTFAVTGHVANTGLIEVPFGTTLREIIMEIAGGVTDNNGNIDNSKFKAVQIGGPSGGCLTAEHLDMPLDFDSLKSVGAMVGSGGLVVMNEDTCMVKIAAYFMQFTQNESCGKCVLCREGTKQMLNLLNDITKGKADHNTLILLDELAEAVKAGSLCALGKTAPSPVLSTISQFKEEYRAHVEDKKCPSGNCKDLLEYKIVPELCKGCRLCAKKCPSGAITGNLKEAHIINTEICTKCGICFDTCKFKAIVKE
ncbi:MAG: SLBB domain-containing protein [Spirochaetales bacterium]|nr:SLBB domain-containing protein [Spirochaetales bacterium]